MSLLVAFGAGEIGDRQINEDRWPSCTPFVWARPEDERGGRSPTGGLLFLSADFVIPNPVPSAPASPASGRTVQSSRKQGEAPLPLEVALVFPVNDRFGHSRPNWAVRVMSGLPRSRPLGRTSGSAASCHVWKSAGSIRSSSARASNEGTVGRPCMLERTTVGSC
jgi:hypothetical protein